MPMFAEFVVRTLLKGPAYLLVAGFALLQFKGLLEFVGVVAKGKGPDNWVIEKMEPGLKEASVILKAAFGNLMSFKFEFTHVVLLAILFAVLMVGEGVAKLTEEVRFRNQVELAEKAEKDKKE